MMSVLIQIFPGKSEVDEIQMRSRRRRAEDKVGLCVEKSVMDLLACLLMLGQLFIGNNVLFLFYLHILWCDCEEVNENQEVDEM